MILFLHVGDAEPFLNSAGDLWDFRDHTNWLEKAGGAAPSLPRRPPDQASERIEAAEESRNEIENHLKSVHSLIDEAPDPRDKAALLLDLARWLGRRNAASPAVEAALAGIDLVPDDRSWLMADLEYELGRMLDLSANWAEALRHYETSLEIQVEIGNMEKEGDVCWNLALGFERRGDLKKAISFAGRTVELRTRRFHPDLEENKKFLAKLEKRRNASRG